MPIKTSDRHKVETLTITKIGAFGMQRKARTTVAAHLHTGIDIKRPHNNYVDEPIFAIGSGIVISMRNDGPFAQIIIEHHYKNKTIWSVYEHIAGILVSVGDHVSIDKPIARFMNKEELNRYGWQFDHLHFEIMKMQPQKLKPVLQTPTRFYNTYDLICYTSDLLVQHYFDPIRFFQSY